MHGKKIILFLSLSVFLFFVVSCSVSDSQHPINEVELITTCTYTLIHQGDTILMTFKDTDGEGGDAPTVKVSSSLKRNTSYAGQVQLLDEMATPVENITEEIAQENQEHQFFFKVFGASGISVTYTDKGVDYKDHADGTGELPVGIKTKLTTSNWSGKDTLTITLKHQPDKKAVGVSSGDMTNAGGETDMQVSFPITIE